MQEKSKKIYWLFIIIILLIGILSGIFFISYLNNAKANVILNNIKEWSINIKTLKINNILPHLFLLSLFLILSSFLIGTPIYIFYIFYNGFTLGFIISTLTKLYSFKGLLYSLIYILISKGLYLFLLGLLMLTFFKIGENVLNNLITAKNHLKTRRELLYKKSLLLLLFIFLNDLFLYFGGNKLLSIFNFLIK